MPILNAPYKNLEFHLANVLEASQEATLDRVYVTAEATEFSGQLRSDPRVEFVGQLSASDLDRYWQLCRAIYFPTQLESFGYPLAEARANGRRVVALNTSQNREIAGSALAAFELDDRDSLAAAIDDAMGVTRSPDRETFDPNSYFSWLTGGGAHEK